MKNDQVGTQACTQLSSYSYNIKSFKFTNPWITHDCKNTEKRGMERGRGKRRRKVISIPTFVSAIEIESGNSQFNLTTLEQQFILEIIDIHFQIKFHQKEGTSTYRQGTDSLIMRI